MKNTIAFVSAVLNLSLSGCAVMEHGRDVPPPPEIVGAGIGTDDGTYHEPVYATSFQDVRPAQVNPPETETRVSFSGNFPSSSARISAWETGFNPQASVVIQTEAMMKGRLLSRAQGMMVPPELAQPTWSALGKFSSLSGLNVSLNTFGAAQHFIPCVNDKKRGKICNEENAGVGLKIQFGKDFLFEGSDFFFEANALKNTKNGLATTFCPGLEVSLIEAWGFSLSPAVASCAGSYYTKEIHKTLPFIGLMPGFSLRHEGGVAINIAFIMDPRNLSAGPAVALGYLNREFPTGNTTNPHSYQNTSFGGPFGGVSTGMGGTFEKKFDAFFTEEKILRKRWR